jgi:hypothetical protein
MRYGAGFSTRAPAPDNRGADAAWLTPQLELGSAQARSARRRSGSSACSLRSRLNGALLTLSRLIYALAARGLPDGSPAWTPAMVPPDALAALLARRRATFLLTTHAHQRRARARPPRPAWSGPPRSRCGRRPSPSQAARAATVAAVALASLFLVFGLGALAQSFPASSPTAVEIADAH